MTPASHLLRAEKIGSIYEDTGLLYCSDDNTYTPIVIQRTAWACSLDNAPKPQSPIVEDLFTALFP